MPEGYSLSGVRETKDPGLSGVREMEDPGLSDVKVQEDLYKNLIPSHAPYQSERQSNRRRFAPPLSTATPVPLRRYRAALTSITPHRAAPKGLRLE